MTKRRKRRKPEQIVKLLQEGEAMLAAGKTSGEVFQKLEVSEATWLRWKKQFGGMKSTRRNVCGNWKSRTVKAQGTAGRGGTGQTNSEGSPGGKLSSPTRRCAAVEHVQRSCGVSQRRACEVLNQSRSSHAINRWSPMMKCRW